MRTHLRYWLPAVLWAAAILVASSDVFSAQHSGAWLEAIVMAVRGRTLPPQQMETLHFFVRKTAHVVEYGMLGALLFRAIRAGRTGWNWRWAVLAVVISTGVATIDERQQSRVRSRSGSPADVALDAGAAAGAQIVIRAAQVLFSLP